MSILTLTNIEKKFGNQKALDGINLSVEEKEFHAIVGENGAGKTTLMNIIYGLYQPDTGSIKLNNKQVSINSPKQAIDYGIGMIHQHFMLVEKLSVVENIVLGLNLSLKKLNLKRHEEKILSMSKELGSIINPREKIYNLPMGLKQRVEIIKALYRNVNLIILDEPTSVLSPPEIESLLNMLSRLKQQNKSILFISHKLEEIMNYSDKVSVMREGKIISCQKTSLTSSNEIARLMIGEEKNHVIKNEKKLVFGNEIMKIRNLCLSNKRNHISLRKINLSLHEGEILGVAGIDGNGQFELAESIAGMLKIDSGSIIVKGNEISNKSINKIKENFKVAYIPEDRHETGLFLNFSVYLNCMMRDFNKKPYSFFGFLNNNTAKSKSLEWKEKYDIKFQNANQMVRFLSGGNQQKIIIAREMAREPDIIIAMQPCKGLDIGAIINVHETLLKEKKSGKSVLYISSELDHILTICDRFLVMFNGEIVGNLTPNEADSEKIGKLMAGVCKGD